MGAGIAQWLSSRQLPVILKDLNAEQVAKGMATIAKIYSDGAKRHAFTPQEARAGLDRISPAPGAAPLGHCDLVIEAAVEKLELKKKIFQGLDESVGENAILATNTSALPVSELAASTRHPNAFSACISSIRSTVCNWLRSSLPARLRPKSCNAPSTLCVKSANCR